METVNLRNGAEELKVAVAAVMMSIRRLLETDGMAFYELWSLCRDPTYKLHCSSVKLGSLVEGSGDNVRVHSTVRNVVVSAVVGDGPDMHIESPIAV